MFLYGLKKIPFLWRYYFFHITIAIIVFTTYLWIPPITTSVMTVIRKEQVKNRKHSPKLEVKPQTNMTAPPGAGRRFPAAIIFGVSKGGTRAALEYLKLHPQVGCNIYY